MDRSKEEAYYVLLEKMSDRITDPATFSRKDFIDILDEFCVLFNLSKGVTEYYLSEQLEAKGEGEVMVDFDNGKGDKVILSKRIVMETFAVLKETLYMAQDAEEPSEDDLKKLDLIVRLLLRFVGYNRMQRAVERFGFYDEYDYPNFRYYKRAVEQLNDKGELYGKTAIYLNLRHYSMVNQEIGRDNANEVMRNYFDLLQMSAGDGGIVCRMGGDNFMMLFEKGLQGQVFEVIRGVPVYYGESFDKSINVSASAGVFVIPDDFVLGTVADLLEKIVSACQVAKTSGKSSIVFYGDELVSRREKYVSIQSMFPIAILKREFQVYYQPKVNVMTGEMVGAEALCRWFKDDKMIPPGDFIPVLEQSSAICQLDFYMLDSVCKDIKRWLTMGKKLVRISVNLSRKHLDDDKLLEHLMDIIKSNDIPHNYLEIELTETTTDVGFKDLKRVVNGLQSEGICTSVDDFGMGYSSLNLIREIPWNVLKVDRCFLPSDEESDKSITSLMFSHVIHMAHDMGLECITEGVETEKQVEILQRNMCTIAQGFFFDRPLPVAEFEERLDKGKYTVRKPKAARK